MTIMFIIGPCSSPLLLYTAANILSWICNSELRMLSHSSLPLHKPFPCLESPLLIIFTWLIPAHLLHPSPQRNLLALLPPSLSNMPCQCSHSILWWSPIVLLSSCYFVGLLVCLPFLARKSEKGITTPSRAQDMIECLTNAWTRDWLWKTAKLTKGWSETLPTN